jgi:cellulose synthase/poly-beta-1,6-N-acetylglucosamine synthase-like glycosyltransferase
MMEGIAIAIIGLTILPFVQVVLFFLQVVASLAPVRSATRPAVERRPRLAVVIPAHNESASIAKTVAGIIPQLGKIDRLVVVADNCSDDTAKRAAAAGAQVTERNDPHRLGKGYALDHGIRFLADASPPEIVILIDSDCEASEGSIDELVTVAMARQHPAQAAYVQVSAAGADRTARIQHFAVTVKNYVRPLGNSRLGLPCQLGGSGMAFPWSIISSIELATGNITEDLKLNADLAIAGVPPVFCANARVTSVAPPSMRGRRTQRIRWEHGHLAIICTYVPRLVWSAYKRKSTLLAVVALDMSIPPLAILTLIIFVLTIADVAVWMIHPAAWALLPTLSTFLIFGLAVALAWYRHGRDIVRFEDLLFVPVYALSKLSTIWRFLTGKKVTWTRSERDVRLK